MQLPPSPTLPWMSRSLLQISTYHVLLNPVERLCEAQLAGTGRPEGRSVRWSGHV